MSRWTNVRPRFRITYTMDSQTLEAFARDFGRERERALRAEAEVRELRDAQSYLLGLSDHWYELWRKAANAVLRLDAELNG